MLLRELVKPFTNWWSQVTDPSVTVEKEEHRRVARMLAGLLLATLFITLAQIISGIMLLQGQERPGLSQSFVLPFLFAALYSLSRTRHYIIAAHLYIILGASALFYFTALTKDPAILFNLAVLMIVASIIFRTRLSLIYNVVVVYLIFIFAVVFPNILPVDSLGQVDVLNLLFFMLFLSIVFIHLSRLQRGNIKQIQAQEKAKRRTQQRLQESEQRFGQLVKTTPTPLLITNANNGIIQYANEAFCDMLGLPEKRVLGRSSTDFYQDPSQRDALLRKVRQTGSIQDFEALMLRNDGSPIWVLISYKMATLDGQEVFIGGVHDIHHRKHMEEQLAESEARVNAIAEATPVPLIMSRISDGRIFFSNDMATNLFGISTQCPSFLQDLFHEGGQAFMNDLAHSDDQVHTREVRLRNAEGSPFWVLISTKQIIDGGQRVCLCGMFDLDHRKMMEERLRQKRDYLATLHEVSLGLLNRLGLNQVLEGLLDHTKRLLKTPIGGIHLISPDKQYMQQVVQAEALSELNNIKLHPGQGLVGKAWLRGETTIVDDYSQWPHRLDFEKASELHQTIAIPMKIRGEVVGMLDLAFFEADRQFTPNDLELLERLAQMAAVAIDNARLFAEVHEAREQAEAGNRSKSTFLANMSHELRTPLNAILGYAQLMTRDTDLSQNQKENLQVISSSGEHLLGLINGVLELSKIEAGRTTLDPSNFDLNSMLRGIESMFSLRARKKGIVLGIELDPALPQFISADGGKLRQVLINLLGNAVKFTQHGHVTLQLRIVGAERTTQGHRLMLRFSVKDTGPGINPLEIEGLFSTFSQTSTGKAAGGSGLGLHISREYVRLMGGDLNVDSRHGVGTTFHFRIPVEEASSEEHSQKTRTKTILGKNEQKQFRILIAEDHEDSQNLMRKLLKPFNFELKLVSDGEQALNLCRTWLPHLIWMDMRMPVMDGYTATQKIRTELGNQAPPIIALTASAFEEERERILAAGCNKLIRKPFKAQDIFDTLATYLDIDFHHETEALSTKSKEKTNTLCEETRLSLPEDWLKRLHHAALLADLESTEKILSEMDGLHDEVTSALREHASEFRFEEIVNFCEHPTP